MKIELEVSYKIDGDDDEKNDIAAEIVDEESAKFVAHLLDVLEARGLSNIEVSLEVDDAQ